VAAPTSAGVPGRRSSVKALSAVHLNAKVVELATSDDMRDRLRSINTVVPTQTPGEMVAYLKDDTARNVELIKATDMKLE
jgi:hypothetical protein